MNDKTQRPVWAVQAGRGLVKDGRHMVNITPRGADPTEADNFTHRLCALLNADEAKTARVPASEEEPSGENAARIERGHTALGLYMGQPGADSDPEAATIDLIADLMHMAEHWKTGAAKIVIDNAALHFEVENEEAEKERDEEPPSSGNPETSPSYRAAMQDAGRGHLLP